MEDTTQIPITLDDIKLTIIHLILHGLESIVLEL